MKKLDHIGIAVKDLQKSKAFYEQALGFTLTGEVLVESQGIKTAFFQLPGEINLELMEPNGANQETSAIAKFLSKKGEGIHHICFEVDSLETTCNKLKEQGAQLIFKAPIKGAHHSLVNFIHPKTTSGVLIELAQK